MAAVTQLSPSALPGGRYAFTAKTASAGDTPTPAQSDLTRIKLRRSTIAAASKLNEVLYNGEVLFDKQTGDYIVGDGVRTWAQLRRKRLHPPIENKVQVAIRAFNYANLPGGM